MSAFIFEAILYALIAIGMLLWALMFVDAHFHDERKRKEREEIEAARAALKAAGEPSPEHQGRLKTDLYA